ncbi:MAG TPA: SurA N-terminal domain-containing protein [Verrucomicrobiae bacterium]|nr:SurA N-terminal domain-containing protein [Verrucomicrobiae bacterium]
MKPNIKKIVGQGKRLASERLRKPEPTAEELRVTNETVAERREEVLRDARKFIYPLGAPKHRIVKWSVGILIAAIVVFFSFCLLELYKFQDTSTFIYGVTQVVPFPVAFVDHHFVSYNDYLFELRRYMHYYATQQNIDFSTKAGKQQLVVFKQRAFDQVIQQAYVAELADKNNITVSDKDVDAAVNLVRDQNRLGASDEVFQSVLSEFWGWSVADFQRELRQEIMAQKVVSQLDTATHTRANAAFDQLQKGVDFGQLAKQVSDDQSTRAQGGDFGALIDRANTQLAPQVTEALFQLSPGKYSWIINTGYSLEIVKVLEVKGTQLRAAHISFNFQPITAYTDPLKKSEPVHPLVRF